MSIELHGMPKSLIQLKEHRKWEQDAGDAYSPYVAVEPNGRTTICFGGLAFSMDAREWFDAASYPNKKGDPRDRERIPLLVGSVLHKDVRVSR
jgi:hypothetical protein